jgi:hypothetical protein
MMLVVKAMDGFHPAACRRQKADGLATGLWLLALLCAMQV